jgi:pimeloyl-ACP methyl ester carboxylesterase
MPDFDAINAKLAAGDLKGARALAPYGVSDMANDGLDLLSALGITRAHVFGTSLGGVIAQTMAIEHPERALTLTSMMSNTGEPEYGQATPEVRQVFFSPAPTDRASYIAGARKALLWGSKTYDMLPLIEAIAAESFDRCFYPEGASRHRSAAMTSGSRAESLKNLALPTLVIHGLDDTLITPSGGVRTASLIPGAKLLLLEGMGHDRPEPLWPVICDAVIALTGQ